jgi:hypothetical protein
MRLGNGVAGGKAGQNLGSGGQVVHSNGNVVIIVDFDGKALYIFHKQAPIDSLP